MDKPIEVGSDMPVLSLSLQKYSRGGSPILGAIKLNVVSGETLALVGPSGIGKTSLLRILAGLETDFVGSCITHGKISIAFQEPALLPWRSLVQNITVTTGISEILATEALDQVGLKHRSDDFPVNLSLGQQRRLSLARAFAVQPKLLLLDEPFVSLDQALADEMKTLFTTLRAAYRVTTILVTHIKSEAESLCDRVVTLGGSPAIITESA